MRKNDSCFRAANTNIFRIELIKPEVRDMVFYALRILSFCRFR